MRPNAADVLREAWLEDWSYEVGLEVAAQCIEALRAAVGATEGQPVVLLADGTLTIAEPVTVYLGKPDHDETLWRISGAES